MFSFKIDPTPAAAFIRDLRDSLQAYKKVHIDLSEMQRVTTDAIAVLLASVKSARSGVTITGTSPRVEEARVFLEGSGFFDHVVRLGKGRGKLPASQGVIKHRTRHRVEPEAANALIAHVTKGLTGSARSQKASYRALIEAMANTREHAQPRIQPARASTRECWWAASAFSTDKGEGYFACVDLGVGIFNSLQIRELRRLIARGLGLKSNADLLREILEGKIASTTGIRYRGKGLPAIFSAAQSGRMRRLVVVSNDAFADVDRGVFETLSPPFRGTIIAWEVATGQIQ